MTRKIQSRYDLQCVWLVGKLGPTIFELAARLLSMIFADS